MSVIIALDRAPTLTHLALDKDSVRSKDQDGRLHIAMNNISKATVDPYYGHEIPNGEELGLDPNRIYYLLRDPDEMAKAAATFNNLPILRKHIPVTAEAPQQDLVIGSTGTDAQFNAPYLQNSAVIWVQDDIDDIEDESKKEWSCGYYYKADMTAGNFNGLRYDGVMRDIVGNHVALVDEGRAGPDVVVADRLPEALKMVLKSRRALMLHGALAAYIAPKMAQDKKLDLSSALSGVTAKNLGKNKAKIAANVVKLAKPVLAQDGELDVDDVVKLIGAVEGSAEIGEDEDEIPEAAEAMDEGDDEPAAKPAVDADDDKLAKVMAFLKGKLSDEDMAEIGNICSAGATDELPEPAGEKDDQPKAKPAMDAASVAKLINRMRVAEREVYPHIGEIKVEAASPEAVYKMALDHAKISTKGVHASAYRSLVQMMPKPDAANPPIAMDRAGAAASFAKRFAPSNLIAS